MDQQSNDEEHTPSYSNEHPLQRPQSLSRTLSNRKITLKTVPGSLNQLHQTLPPPPSRTAPTDPRNQSKRRVMAFFETMARERAPKSRRLDIVNQLRRCEKERLKHINTRDRIRRQIVELRDKLEEEETHIIEIENRVRRLKDEDVV